MIAVPTRELSGQFEASACGRGQERNSASLLGPRTAGRVTSARFSAACSGLKRSVVVTGG